MDRASPMGDEASAGGPRADLADLIARYAHALDAADTDAALACFAPDVVAEYEGGTLTIRGLTELSRLLRGALTGPSTHLISNVLIEEIEPEAARVRCAAIVCATRRAGFVTVRGVQYEFACVHGEAGWRIGRLRHAPAWEFTAPSSGVSPA